MILDASLLIRAASGVVFLAVGIILVWSGRRARDRLAANLALAVACAAFGGSFIAVNLLGTDSATVLAGIVLQACLAVVAAVSVVLFVGRGWLRRHVRRRDVGLLFLSILGGFGFSSPDFARTLYFAQAFPAEAYGGLVERMWRLDGFAMLFVLGAFTLLIQAAGRAHRVATDARERKGLALLSVGFFAYPAFMTGVSLSLAALDPGHVLVALPVILLLVSGTLTWLRTAPIVALVFLVIALLGQLGPVFGNHPAAVGVLRIMAAALIALALLRYGLAGADLHRPTARRGSLAAGSLASLFIVAQIAQEFFAAEYGLLMGGVVAGTLLFAANPIQRTMERLAGHERPGALHHGAPGPDVAPSPDADREQAYRDAVGLALRDRMLTRDEERRLLRLAYHLGVPTPRAMELLDEAQGQERAGA